MFLLAFAGSALGVGALLPAPARDAPHLDGLRIAHRGGSAWGPENTLEAVERAAARGANAVEVDVWLTADGVPVVLHDATVDRTTDGTGPVGEFTLAELQRLDADPDPVAVARVPTLKALLTTAKRLDLRVELELKTELDRPDEVIAALVQQVLEQDMTDQVWVGSFDPTLLYAVRRAEPSIVTALCIRQNATGNPLIDRALVSRWLPWALGVSLIEPHLEMVDAGSVEAWRRRGYVINAWTANGAAEQARLASLGVGYTSNCPGEDCEDQHSDALD